MGGVGGTLYVQNYRDGTAIAKAKAKEALAAEKENIIQSYKESRRFREDACKEVAANMSYIDTGYYLYKNMRSKDINKYPDLGKFYSSFLKSSYDDYVKKYGSK